MEIRDTRNGDWHWVYNALLADPHLTPGEKIVYSSISTFGGHQVIHPTKEQLAARCGVDTKTVQRALIRLEEVGYLSIERSTGRGNANVYWLLKKPKGCNLCPFIKGDIEDDKRGHLEPKKGTETTPHIDKIDIKDISATRIVIEKDEEKPNRESKAKYPHSKEVFGLWEVSPRNWTLNTTQLRAAENLYEERGIEAIQEALQFIKDFGHTDFFPSITSPYDLDSKWAKLEAKSKELAKKQ